MPAHDDDVEQMRLKVLGWRDRALDVWEEVWLRVEGKLPPANAVRITAACLVLACVGGFFAIDGRLPILAGLGITLALIGGSTAAGWWASRFEPAEEDTTERDADLAALIAAYAGPDNAGIDMDDTVDLDPGDRRARFNAFIGAVWWLHLPWITVYALGVVMPAVAVLPIGETTQKVAVGCTVMPALLASSLVAWAVWSRAVVRGAVRAGIRPARVLTGHIAAVGIVCLTASTLWGLVGASPWAGGDEDAPAVELAEDDPQREDAQSDAPRDEPGR